MIETLEDLDLDVVDLCIQTAVKTARQVERGHLEWLRSFDGDPHKYFRDRLRWTLTKQQEEALEHMRVESRLLIPAANAVGKTFLLAGYGLYVFEVLGTLPDKIGGRRRQGARILLPGPDASTIYATVYSEILDHAQRAERQGPPLPGIRSEKSVHWFVRPKWNMEAFSPRRLAGQEVRHSAAGRHHPNMVALIEEGQGVDEPTWRGVEGMCVSAGNQIISSFNPTEPTGPAYQRALSGGYKVLHLDAFDHPNIQQRHYVIPAAIDFKRIDDRVRVNCQDMGPLSVRTPDYHHHEFVYALPPKGAEECGARQDGHPGHPMGELHVFRPDWDFTSRVRGLWPQSSIGGLFSPAAWDASVERWSTRNGFPSRPPDCIGLDSAREGNDDSVMVHRWGPDPQVVISNYLAAQGEGDTAEQQRILAKQRIRIGTPVVLPKGDGPTVARAVVRHNASASPINCDEGGVGASVLDHLKRMFRLDATGVSFGSSAQDPLPGEQIGENLRASMYIRAAFVVNLGLVDIPPEPRLREEVMATEIEIVDRTFHEKQIDGTVSVERRPVVKLKAKKEIKKAIGRSPDFADAFVLALHSPRRKSLRRGKRGYTSFQ